MICSIGREGEGRWGKIRRCTITTSSNPSSRLPHTLEKIVREDGAGIHVNRSMSAHGCFLSFHVHFQDYDSWVLGLIGLDVN